MSAPLELQRRFQDAILQGELTPGLFAVEDAAQEGGFRIYLNAYRLRLTEALRDNFPVLRAALGDEAFDELAAAYLAQHPSPHRSVRWFGDSLTDWLEQNPAVLPHPALTDVARMDWALRGAFDAADSVPLAMQDLAALAPQDWPEQRFRLRPGVVLLPLTWQIEPIWQSLSENPDAVTEAPDQLEHQVLIWRADLQCHWRSLEAPESAALATLAGGGTFADVCEVLAAYAGDQAAVVAAGLLRAWVEQTLLGRDDTASTSSSCTKIPII